MEAHIRKLINARSKAIQAFKTDIDTKRGRFFEYTFALFETGLISKSELDKVNGTPRFWDEEDKA